MSKTRKELLSGAQSSLDNIIGYLITVNVKINTLKQTARCPDEKDNLKCAVEEIRDAYSSIGRALDRLLQAANQDEPK